MKRRDRYWSLMLCLIVMPALSVSAIEPTSISISVSPSTVAFGQSVIVSGAIAPEVPGVEVILTYTRPDGTTFTRSTMTSLHAAYVDVYAPEKAGTWGVVASWSGNDRYAGATSSSLLFTTTELPPGTSTISCMTDSSAVIIGDSINISGKLVPTGIAPITIEVSTDGGTSWTSLSTVTSASDGIYQYLWTPTSTGSYLLRARWSGDSSHTAATSNSVVSVIVNPLFVPDFNIIANPSTQTVNAGGTVSFTVTIASLHGFNFSVNLAVSGLPANAEGSFNPPSVSGNGTSILTVSTSDSTPQGTSTVTISATGGELTRSASVSLEVTTAEKPPSPTVPFIGVPEILIAILMGLFVVARKKRRKGTHSNPNRT